MKLRPGIVLLEDIDAVGMQRNSELEGMEKDMKKKKNKLNNPKGDNTEDDGEEKDMGEEEPATASGVTLAGLLNILDGVTSQEGRIVIMTSNFAHRLDTALTRPGRIDCKVYLGNMSPESARLMFLRIYAPDPGSPAPDSIQDREVLEKLAVDFSSQVPDRRFTPAQLQVHDIFLFPPSL